MSAKIEHRRRMRALRAAHPGGAIRVATAFRDRLSPGLMVASYIPVGGEADPAPLVEAALAAGCRLALPHVVDRATPMRFLAWDAAMRLTLGPFGLLQPDATAAGAEPDIILAPLLAFDAFGHRLGQGAGHYDRAFVAHPEAWRVGVAWAVQRVERLEPDPWDVPLHAIATDQDWITP